MIAHGLSSYQNNLKLCFDSRNPKSWDGTIFTDLISRNDANNIGDPSWLNNIRYTTISMVIEWYQLAYGYADHPISKFNSTLQNASLIQKTASVTLKNLDTTEHGWNILQLIEHNLCIVQIWAGYETVFPYFQGFITNIDTFFNY